MCPPMPLVVEKVFDYHDDYDEEEEDVRYGIIMSDVVHPMEK